MSSSSKRNNLSYHPGVRCHGCQMEPIEGARYLFKEKDGHVSHSLCSACYAAHEGVPTHMYAVLATPLSFQEFLPPRLSEDAVYHPGILCVGCGEKPIQGPRYICRAPACAAHGINLCGSCYSAGQHATSHPFWRLDDPLAYKEPLEPRDA